MARTYSNRSRITQYSLAKSVRHHAPLRWTLNAGEKLRPHKVLREAAFVANCKELVWLKIRYNGSAQAAPILQFCDSLRIQNWIAYSGFYTTGWHPNLNDNYSLLLYFQSSVEIYSPPLAQVLTFEKH